MNTPDRADHWKTLAQLLGADVPDPAPAEQKAQQTPPEESDKPTPVGGRRAKPKPSLPPRVPGDWNALASQLGIELPEPPPVEESQQQDQAEGQVSEILERTDEQQEPTSVPTDLPPAEEPAAEEVFGDSFGAGVLTPETEPPVQFGSGIAFFEPDSAAERDLADVDVPTQPEDTEQQEGPLDPDVQLEQPGGEASEAAEEVPTRKRRKRGRRAGSKPSKRDEQQEAEADAAPVEPEEELDEPLDEQGEEAEGDQRGRERRPRRRRRRPTRKGDTDVEPGEAELDEEAGDDTTVEQSGRPKHRKIPTWEEAIGMIVESNLESRSRNNPGKNGPRGQRRRGQGQNRRRS